MPISSKERFWSRVSVQPEGCWDWLGANFANGYGSICKNGKQGYVHRFSWELHYGAIPENLWVLHHCDNRHCVRPDHLFLGTRLDNVRDMEAKGRGRQLAGEQHNMAKLTEADVREIRAKRGIVVGRELARTFGVTPTTISHIQKMQHWKHIN